MITLYTSARCVWCKKMKNYLEEKNVLFETLDVGNPANAERAYNLSGQNAVPVTVIGSRVIVGFDRNAVDKAIAQMMP